MSINRLVWRDLYWAKKDSFLPIFNGYAPSKRQNVVERSCNFLFNLTLLDKSIKNYPEKTHAGH